MSTSYYFDPDDLQQNAERRRRPNFLDTYLRNREYGFRPKYGDRSRLHSDIYTSVYPMAKWEYDMLSTYNPGCINNLEFSPNGRIVAAACQNGFLLFDPVIQKHIISTKEAHSDCVNSIKFLDSHVFATCSDDTTIAVWDVRNLKKNIMVLKGHINWVKSIEYSEKDDLLVSSGFDGQIYSWDINSYSDYGGIKKKPLCNMNGVMRIKLLPDSSKMVICMTSGYIILINNLDLETLAADIKNFNPNMYRLMQLNKNTNPGTAAHTHMFTRERNRVEFIVDFPRNNGAEIISSIQIHPQGWNILSRNVTSFEETEWTCVHDIQDLPVSRDLDEPGRLRPENSMDFLTENTLRLRHLAHLEEIVYASDELQYQNWPRTIDLPLRNPTEVIDAISLNHNNRDLRMCNCIFQPYNHSIACFNRYQVPLNHKIHMNSKRLTHFIEEPNVGRGFIKELCYSSDGRIICSPFKNGVRLLSFSPNCDELSTIQPKPPGVNLYEIGKNMSHDDIVLCTNFSPIQPLLVSGCAAGRIVWYQPRL